MANTIAELSINLTANTAQLSNNLAKAVDVVQDSTKRMSGSFKAMQSDIRQVRSAMQLWIGALGVRQMANWIAHADAVAKAAREAGIIINSEVVKGANDTTAAVERMGAAVQGALLQGLNEVAPVMKGLAVNAQQSSDIWGRAFALSVRIAGQLAGAQMGGVMGRTTAQTASQGQQAASFDPKALAKESAELFAAEERHLKNMAQDVTASEEAVRIRKAKADATAKLKKQTEDLVAAEALYLQGMAQDVTAGEEAARIRKAKADETARVKQITDELVAAELRHVEAMKLDVTAGEAALRIRREQAKAERAAHANADLFASTVSSMFVAGIFQGQTFSEVLRNISLQLAQMILQAQLYKAIMGIQGFKVDPVMPVPTMAIPGGSNFAPNTPFMQLPGGGGGGGGGAVPMAVRTTVDLNRRGIVRLRR